MDSEEQAYPLLLKTAGGEGEGQIGMVSRRLVRL